MKIQIDGTNTLNKGAELMLYAILQELEKKTPKPIIYYNSNYMGDSGLIHTTLDLKRPFLYKYSRSIVAVLRRLNLPYDFFTSKYPAANDISIVLDGAGFQFSDQWNYTEARLTSLENYYKRLKIMGAKIILLPQALGPFETSAGKRLVQIMDKYVDVIIAREKVSYDYIMQARASKDKVWLYPDFTLTVKGIMPRRYEHLKNKVCIIPNKKMVTHTDSSTNQYIEFIKQVILRISNSGKDLFLLNHEGSGDLRICEEINQQLDTKLEIVTGLNALEIKGLIGQSELVISSRFHGVASALNQGVPCLATSWNHKYQMLFKDFGQFDKVLEVNQDWEKAFEKIRVTFEDYDEIKAQLTKHKAILLNETKNMWDRIWK